MSIVHVLGNGPSQQLWFNAETKGQVVACNMPYQVVPKERLWASIIGDFKVMRAINEGSLDLSHMPWVFGTRPKMYCDQNPSFHMKWAQNIREFYTYVPPYSANATDWSAGHLAVHYTCMRLQPKELHMWGFDSMFSHDLSSASDLLIESNREANNRFRMNAVWRPIWQNLFQEMNNVNFVIHYDKKANLQFEVTDNVRVEHH